jgi:hypothetical protein
MTLLSLSADTFRAPTHRGLGRLCLCSLQVAALGRAVAGLDLRLAMPRPAASLQAGLALLLSPRFGLHLPRLPEFGMSLALRSKLQAVATVAGALSSLRFGLGITPRNAGVLLPSLAASLNANGAALAALPVPTLAPLQAAAELAVCVQTARLGLGMNLLTRRGQAAFRAALAAALSVGPPAPSGATALSVGLSAPSGSAAVLLELAVAVHAVQTGFGINLLLPGGVARLNAALALLASVKLPSLSLNLPGLANVLALAGALLAIKMSLGLDLRLPGAAAKLSAILSLLVSLKLPSLPPPGGSLALLAGMDLTALASLDLGGLHLPAPALGLASYSLIGSLAAAVHASFGINLVASAGCPICTVL